MIHDTVHENHYLANEGKVFTNKNGVYTKELWLADWDSIENWTEVNEEEADA